MITPTYCPQIPEALSRLPGLTKEPNYFAAAMDVLKELNEGTGSSPIRIPVAAISASNDNDEVSVGEVKLLDIGRHAVTVFANVDSGALLARAQSKTCTRRRACTPLLLHACAAVSLSHLSY